MEEEYVLTEDNEKCINNTCMFWEAGCEKCDEFSWADCFVKARE